MVEIQHTPFRLERVEAEWSHSFKALDGMYFRIRCCEDHVCGVAFTPSRAQLFMASPQLLASLKAAVDIVADELENIVECHTLKGDRDTLDEAARPDVARFEAVLAEAREAIAKAEGRQ